MKGKCDLCKKETDNAFYRGITYPFPYYEKNKVQVLCKECYDKGLKNGDNIREIDKQILLLRGFVENSNQEWVEELLKECLIFGITDGIKSTALLYEISSFIGKNGHYPTEEEKEQIKEKLKEQIAKGEI